jgi:heme exporter protein D
MRWFVERPGLAVGLMVGLLVLACLLSWVDPVVRARQVLPLIPIGGWVSMAAFPLLLMLFGEHGPAAVFVWGVAGLYVLAIVGTVGRPLLIFSDLLEEAESEGSRISAADWRRSRIGQVFLCLGIVAGVTAVLI